MIPVIIGEDARYRIRITIEANFQIGRGVRGQYLRLMRVVPKTQQEAVWFKMVQQKVTRAKRAKSSVSERLSCLLVT